MKHRWKAWFIRKCLEKIQMVWIHFRFDELPTTALESDIRRLGSIPGSGVSPGHSNPLQYSCLEPGSLPIGLQRVGQDWSDLAGTPFTSRVLHDSVPIFLICKMGTLTELSWKLGESSEILRKYPAFGMDHTGVCHYLSSVFSHLKSDPPLDFSALRTM